MLSITSPAQKLVSSFEFRVDTSFHQLGTRNPKLETDPWWLWVESNHQPRAYETLALSA
jgi:hypothetical protein